MNTRRSFFPSLRSGNLKKIPGNGGRFNTFLRQPLLNFARPDGQAEPVNKTFEYKDRIYSYEISAVRSGSKRITGYFIQVSDVTDVVICNK